MMRIVNTEKKEPLIQQTQSRVDNIKSVDDEVINSDNLSDAEKQLQHIKDNPQEWGTISQRGTELINLVFPIPFTTVNLILYFSIPKLWFLHKYSYYNAILSIYLILTFPRPNFWVVEY